MAEKGVLKGLGLENYLWSILNSSQDDNSSSNSSQNRRLTTNSEDIEHKRGEFLDEQIENRSMLQESANKAPLSKFLGAFNTPSVHKKKFSAESPPSQRTENLRNNLISPVSLKMSSSAKITPDLMFAETQIDQDFFQMNFSQSAKTAESHNSIYRDKFSIDRSLTKSKLTPNIHTDKVRSSAYTGHTFDEEDFELISQALEEDLQKTSNIDAFNILKCSEAGSTNSQTSQNPTTCTKETPRNNMHTGSHLLETASGKATKLNKENITTLFDFGELGSDLKDSSDKTSSVDKDSLGRNTPLKTGLGFSTFSVVPKKSTPVNANSLGKLSHNSKSGEESEPTLKTASMKPIPISKVGLDKASALLQSNDENIPPYNNFTDNFDNLEESIDNNNIFEKLEKGNFDQGIVEGALHSRDIIKAEAPVDSDKPFMGLQTASFKPIRISSANYNRAKDLLKLEEEEDLTLGGTNTVHPKNELSNIDEFLGLFDEDDEEDKQQQQQNQFPTLQTASMKPIHIKQENLNKVKILFDSEEEEVPVSKATTPRSTTNKITNVNDLLSIVKEDEHLPIPSTASIKPIGINQTKTSNFRNPSDSTSPNPKKISCIDDFKDLLEDDYDFPSIKTASMKPININDENLQKAKNLLEVKEENSTVDDKWNDNGDDDDYNHQKDSKDAALKGENQFTGLQTASMKPITINQTNLDRIKKIFESDDDTASQESSPNFMTMNQSNMHESNNSESSFATLKIGSMKPLYVNKEKLAKAMTLLEQDEADFKVPQQSGFNKSQERLDLVDEYGFGNPSNDFGVGFKKLPSNESFKFSQDEFSFNFARQEKNNKMDMEGETKLMTASMKPISIDNDKLQIAEKILKSGDEFDIESANSTKCTLNLTKEHETNTGRTVFYGEKQNADKVIKIFKSYSPNKDSLNNQNYGKVNGVSPLTTKYHEAKDPNLEQMDLETGKPQKPLLKNQSDFRVGKKLQFSTESVGNAFRLLNGDSKENPSRPVLLNNRLKQEDQGFLPADNSKKTSVSLGFDEVLEKRTPKKVLTEDLRNKKSPTNMLTFNQTSNFGIENKQPLKNLRETKDVKKSHKFRFAVENTDKPATTTTNQTNTTNQPTTKNNLKRNHNEFKRESLGIETFILAKFKLDHVFKHNQKINSYILAHSSNSKSLPPRKKYFFLENVKKRGTRGFGETSDISINTLSNYKFICPCANYFGSQTIGTDSPVEYPCHCNGSLAIGWEEIHQLLIKDGLNKEYITEVFIFNLKIFKFDRSGLRIIID